MVILPVKSFSTRIVFIFLSLSTQLQQKRVIYLTDGNRNPQNGVSPRDRHPQEVPVRLQPARTARATRRARPARLAPALSAPTTATTTTTTPTTTTTTSRLPRAARRARPGRESHALCRCVLHARC